MNGLEAQISSIFRRFQRKEMEFNCCCSIDSPVFLRWKWLKTHWRRIFSGFVAYSKARKVSRFLFAISTASLYAAENAFVFGSRRLPYERSWRQGGSRGGKSATTIQKFWKFCVHFSNKKTTRNKKNLNFPSIWSSLWFYVAVLQWKT